MSNSCSSIVFWNLDNYNKEKTINDVRPRYPSHMIELTDSNIAVSHSDSPYPIIIIETNNYTIIQKITVEGYTSNNSSLHLVSSNSFMYAYSGRIVYFSTTNYNVLFKDNNVGDVDGQYGITTTKNGRYIIITSRSNGLVIFEQYY